MTIMVTMMIMIITGKLKVNFNLVN